MISMSYTKRNQKKNGPLLVKEVILPKNGGEAILCSSGKNCEVANNSKKDLEYCSVKPNVAIGDHESLPVGGLRILKKKPLESYFEGSQERRISRKKIRQPKQTRLICLDFQSSPTACYEGWISASTEASLKRSGLNVVEEKLKKQEAQMKLTYYKRMKEDTERKFFRQQRLKEENYMEDITDALGVHPSPHWVSPTFPDFDDEVHHLTHPLDLNENLAETWLGVIKRHKQMRDINSENFHTQPRPKCRHNLSRGNRIDISLLPKKYWNEDEAEKFSSGAEEKIENEKTVPSGNKSPAVDLMEEFYRKLVFVDDEDVDDEHADSEQINRFGGKQPKKDQQRSFVGW